MLYDAYPSAEYRDNRITRTFTPAQRKAVTRAMRSYARKHQRYALAGGQGRKQLYLYEPDDPLSAMWAKMQVANRKPNPVTSSEAKTALRKRKPA